MKKGFKAVTAAALAISALTPVAAFAAENTVENGVYTTTNFYSLDAFKKLSGSAKAAALTSEGAVIVVAGKVYTGANVISLNDTQLDASAVTVDAYNAANDNKLVSGKPIGGENQTGELKVESVKAINGKQLVVKFDKAVDKASVIGGTPTAPTLVNGVITLERTSTDVDANAINTNALNGQTATLSEDGKTLTVTAASTKYLKGNYDIKIAVAKSASTGTVIENTYVKVTAADTVAPVVSKVEYNKATDKFEVTFSEPIDAKTGEVVRVNGQPVTTGFDALAAPTTKLTFSRPTTVELGTNANLYIAGIKDATGNLMTAYNGQIQLDKDASALEVAEVKQLTDNTVQVKFNKKLNSASATAIKAKTGLIVTKSNGDTTTNYTVADVAPADDMTYIFTLTDATYANGNTEKFAITFVDKAFTGVSGTANVVITKQVELNKDTVSPKATSATLSVDKASIEVKVSEGLSNVDATKVKLRLDGVELTPVTASLKAGTDNVILISSTAAITNSILNAGTYQVRFEADALTDLNGNKNVAGNAPAVTVEGTNTAQPLGVTIADGGATNTFTVTATEELTAASLNYQNFTLDGQVIDANSDITFDSDKKVITIALPASNTLNFSGSAILEAKNLVFKSGKQYKTSAATVTAVDNTSATLTGAKILGNVLELTFDEAVNPSTLTNLTDVLGDFTIASSAGTYATAGTESATVEAGTSANKLVINVTPDAASNWATVVAGNDLTITTKGTGVVTKLTDANSVKVKAGTKVNITK